MTRLLLWLVARLNHTKDRQLAYRLAELTRQYDPRDGTTDALVVDGLPHGQ